MDKNQPAALLAAGKISESPLRRLPLLAARIGPVWAPSSGLATRFVRTLKAGHKAASADELLKCPIWILHAPGARLAQLVSLALECRLPLRGRVIAALDDRAGSEHLRVLETMGAHVASFWAVPLPGRPLFFVEGNAVAVNHVKALLRRAGLSSLRLTAGAKPRFVTAAAAVNPLLIPMLEAVAMCLASAGASRPVAQRLAVAWMEGQTRAYASSGRKAWADPRRGVRQSSIENGLVSLNHDHPILARALEAALGNGLHLMQQPASARAAAASKI